MCEKRLKISIMLWSAILVLALVVTAACAPAAAPTPTTAPKPAIPKSEAPKTEATKAPAPVATPAPKPAAATPAPAAQKPEVSQIKTAVMLIENAGTIYAADKLGFFKDEGLTIDNRIVESGGENLVVAGQVQFSYTNTPSIIQARSQGFDVVIVTANAAVTTPQPPASGLYVKADSPIKTAKDLEGKRIGMVRIRTLAWLTARGWLKDNGVDVEKTVWREIPFPQMGDAIVNGMVDAGYMVEPFITIWRAQEKLRFVANVDYEFQGGMDISPYVASEKWVKQNPVTTRAFARAVGRAMDALNKDRSLRNRFAVEFAKANPDLVDKLGLMTLRTKVDAKALQKTADLMLEHGLLDKKFDVSPMIWETAK
ncbi:MAG: ABC transporter substrate-binding protein [Chloroflexi bacterium]|nr:ABC transporter substrate-binding protein [Chloroflexota bacterium]